MQQAARLFREQGVNGTSLLTVLEAARAPRGSLYHHFPGGKDQLVLEALRYESDRVTGDVETLLAALPAYDVAIGAFAETLAASLETSDFRLGCPVSTAALELSSQNEAVRDVCAGTYRRWEELLRDHLARTGHPNPHETAELTLAALEGSLLLARAKRDGDIVRRVGAALARLPTCA